MRILEKINSHHDLNAGAGKRLEFINPRNTSQICSGCCKLVKKELSKRTHSCSFCSLVLNRDHNTAINLSLGLQSIRKTDKCLSL